MEQSKRLNKIIDTLVNSNDEQETQQAYKDWSSTYDDDLEGFGYVAPQTGVELFHTAVDGRTNLKIFDAGCGTGRVGQLLHAKGYRHIHGADFSPEMLAKAKALDVYETLSERNFREPLPIPDNQYDGILCIGVYSSFIGEPFIRELVRIGKPKATLVLSCRPVHYDGDLENHIAALAKEGKVVVQAHETRPYMTGQNAIAHYLVLRIESY